MSEENKAIARRLVEEAFVGGNLDLVDELVTPTYTPHDPASPPGLPDGPEGVKLLIQGYRSAFPDLRISIDTQIAEGDYVTTRWTATGTHQGELMGVAPTGKQATVTGITIDRIENGQVAESWDNWDTFGLLQQLGAIPAPATATATTT